MWPGFKVTGEAFLNNAQNGCHKTKQVVNSNNPEIFDKP